MNIEKLGLSPLTSMYANTSQSIKNLQSSAVFEDISAEKDTEPELAITDSEVSTDSADRTDENSADYGETTEYYTTSNGYRYYFTSGFEALKANFMTDEAIQKSAVARQSIELKGGTDIKNNDDAVVLDKGSKSEYYIDKDGIRYYYNSSFEFLQAATSNDFSKNSTGQARVMSEWGMQTKYYMDVDGSRYFFKSEEDKNSASKILEESGSGLLGMLKFNKYIVGRC